MATGRRNAGKVGTWEIILGTTFLGVTVVIFGLGIWVGRSLGPQTDTSTERVVRAEPPARPADADIAVPVGPEFYEDHRRSIEERLTAPAESPSGETAAAGTTDATTPALPRETPVWTLTPTSIPPTATRTQTRTPTIRPMATPTRPPATRPPTATSAPAARGTPRFVVLVGETRSEQQAFAWVGDLRRLGFQATTQQRTVQGARVFAVRVGPFETRDAATDAARRISATGRYPDAQAAIEPSR